MKIVFEINFYTTQNDDNVKILANNFSMRCRLFIQEVRTKGRPYIYSVHELDLTRTTCRYIPAMISIDIKHKDISHFYSQILNQNLTK